MLTKKVVPRTALRNRKAILCFLLTVIFPAFIVSTPVEAQTFSLSGFVKAEGIYDTRQVLNIREGQFHLYPLPDSEANEQDNLLFAAWQSRLVLSHSGAQAFGADASAVIEADFFGATNATLSHLILRRAALRLDWGTHEVLVGQEWSPFFTAAVFPQVVGFNTGAPFQPFGRFPQATVTLKPDNIRVIGSLSMHRDAFSSLDLSGAANPRLHQWAALPAVHGHVQYVTSSTLVGAGGYLKTIRPEILSDRVTSGAATAYGRFNFDGFDLRLKAVYGSDLTDHLMTGGYIVQADDSFAPLRVASGWVDVMSTGSPLSVGLYAGYLTNLGASDTVSPTGGGLRAPDMANLWRVAPRVWYTSGPARLAFELEVTSATYSETFDDRFQPLTDQTSTVTNIRPHLAAYYFF